MQTTIIGWNNPRQPLRLTDFRPGEEFNRMTGEVCRLVKFEGENAVVLVSPQHPTQTRRVMFNSGAKVLAVSPEQARLVRRRVLARGRRTKIQRSK